LQDFDGRFDALRLVVARLLRPFYAWSMFVDSSSSASSSSSSSSSSTDAGSSHLHLRFNRAALTAIADSLTRAAQFLEQSAFGRSI
jgi:hypothetical protein